MVTSISALVSLVLVSHSPRLLDALQEMIRAASNPAPPLHLAGGTQDGRLGTSLSGVLAALRGADTPDGTLVIYDSGSAWLTIGFALDALGPSHRARIVVSGAPLVEGALAAAARAARGAPLAEVARAAADAMRSEKQSATA